MRPKDWLKALLQGQGTPVISFIDSAADGYGEEYLSAANLWNLIFHRAKQLRGLGLRDGDVLIGEVNDMNGLVDCLSAMVLDVGFWAVKSKIASAVPEIEPSAQRRGEPHANAKRFKVFANQEIVCAALDRVPQFTNQDFNGLIIATSGSAERPGQPVLLNWQKVVRQVQLHAEYWHELEGASRLSILPKFHCFGLILDFMVGLAQRQTVYLSFGSAQRNRHILNWISSNKIQISAMTPRQLWIMCEQAERDGATDLDLTVHSGGAMLDDDLRRRCQQIGVKVIDGYGLTEAGPGVLMNGRPLGCEVKIKRAPDSTVDHDTSVGELWVKSETLGDFEGKQIDSEGFMATGDLAERVGDQIIIHGRLKDKLKKNDGTWVSRDRAERDLRLRFDASKIFIVGPSANGFELHVVADNNWSGAEALARYVLERYGITGTVQVFHAERELFSTALRRPGKELRPLASEMERAA